MSSQPCPVNHCWSVYLLTQREPFGISLKHFLLLFLYMPGHLAVFNMHRRGASTWGHKWEDDLLMLSPFYLMLLQLLSILYFGKRPPRSSQKKYEPRIQERDLHAGICIGWLHWGIKMNESTDLESQTPTECTRTRKKKDISHASNIPFMDNKQNMFEAIWLRMAWRHIITWNRVLF